MRSGRGLDEADHQVFTFWKLHKHRERMRGVEWYLFDNSEGLIDCQIVQIDRIVRDDPDNSVS